MKLNWIEARRVAKKAILRVSPTIEANLLEDIVQDAIERALLKLARFDESKGTFNAWIAKIAKNVFIDFTRRNGKYVFINHEFTNLVEDENEYFAIEEREVAVLLAVEKLKERDKNLIKMRHFENLSFEEIGNITGIPEKNVPVYIMRARKELKNYIIEKQILPAA
jgi:RNA polymerase sigma-70 factor (ECF subfamily)